MELSELKFAVNTDQLKEAVDLLGKVQQGTADLGKAQVQQEKSAKKAAKSQTEVSDALEDSEKKISPLEKLLQKLNNQYGDLVKGFTKGEAAILQQARTYGAAEDALQPFIAELEKIKELTKDPFDASVGAIRSVSAEFDRLSQRAELAQRGISLSTKQLSEYSRISAEVKGKVLELGMDPKSAAGVEKFNQLLAENRNEYLKVAAAANALEQAESLRNKTLRDNERLLAANLQAQATMMNDAVKLYRNAEADKAKALATRMRMEATAGDNAVQLFYKNEQQKQKAFEARMKAEATMMDGAVIKYYTMLNKPSNNKTQIQSARDLAQATKWLATEESRMVSVLNTLNQVQDRNVEVSEKAARSVANYERNLAKAGITGEAAAAKLDVYRKQQLAIQSVEERRQSQFLTRALQPQIGDVAVSLAAGQNPLTVLLQQGDQIRGLIAQTGVQGEALRTVMRNAFTDTIKSVKDTAIAMGSVLGGAFIALGNNVMGLVTGPFSAFRASIAAGATATGSFSVAVDALNAAFLRLVGNPVVALMVAIGTALTALGIAAYKSLGQYGELNKSLVLNGAVMQMSAGQAIDLAKSLDTTGDSASKYVDVMILMAKEGLNVGSNFKSVADSAIDMQKYLGVAIEDTIKKYKALTTDPLKGLIDLAKTTGGVSAETIKLVAELEREGKTRQAVEIAIKAQSEAEKSAVAKAIENAGYVETAWRKAIGSIKSMWESLKSAVMGWGAQDTIDAQIKSLEDQKKAFGLGGMIGANKQISMIDAQIEGLKEQQKLLTKSRDIEAQRNQLAVDMGSYQTDITAGMNEQAKRSQAIAKATLENNRLVAAGQITEAQAADRIKAIEEKYKDKKVPKSDAMKAEEKAQKALNASLELYNDTLNKGTGYNKEFNDAILSLMVARDKGKKSQDEYNAAVNALVQQQPFYVQMEREAAEAAKKRADNQEWLNSVMGRSEGLTKDYTQGTERLMQMLGAGDINPEQFREALGALNKLTPAYKAYEVVLANYGKTVADIEAQRKATADEYGMDFKTDEEKASLQSLSKFKRSLAEADAEFNKALTDAKKFEDANEYQSMIDAAQDVADRRKAVAQDVYDREKYLQSQTYQMYAAGFEALKGLSANFSTAVADQFVNFAKTGKSSFEDLTSSFGNMVENMIYDLIRLQIQKQVAGLLDMGVSAAVSYFGGGATTGSSQYALTSGGSGLASMGGGTGLTAPKMFAKGGVVDGLTMFSHSGGTGGMGEAGPEAIMPLKRDSSGSLGVAVTGGGSAGSNVEVVINNYGSDKATTTETTDSRGNRKINITIGEMVSGEISRSGSAVQKSMQATYGQRPQLIRR
jgi:lambda family phage tail tape measure protein